MLHFITYLRYVLSKCGLYKLYAMMSSVGEYQIDLPHRAIPPNRAVWVNLPSSTFFLTLHSSHFKTVHHKQTVSFSHSNSMLHHISSIHSPNLHSFLRIKVRNVRQSPHLRTWHSFTPRLATNFKSKMSQNPASSDAESRRPKKFICTNKVYYKPQLLYCAQVKRENYPAGN